MITLGARRATNADAFLTYTRHRAEEIAFGLF
jgi:hypothetical protein